jgi:hypothetical protein
MSLWRFEPVISRTHAINVFYINRLAELQIVELFFTVSNYRSIITSMPTLVGTNSWGMLCRPDDENNYDDDDDEDDDDGC